MCPRGTDKIPFRGAGPQNVSSLSSLSACACDFWMICFREHRPSLPLGTAGPRQPVSQFLRLPDLVLHLRPDCFPTCLLCPLEADALPRSVFTMD